MRKGIKWLAACCVVPVVLALGLSYFGVGPAFSWLPTLLCPLLMIGGIWAFSSAGGGNSCCGQKECHKEKAES